MFKRQWVRAITRMVDLIDEQLREMTPGDKTKIEQSADINLLKALKYIKGSEKMSQ